MVLRHSDVQGLLHQFDVDGDGKLSPSELCMCMRTVGDDLSLEDAEELVVFVDSDGDGLLGFEDFVNLVEVGGEDDERDEELRQAFGVYEMEGSGCITAASLMAELRVVGVVKGIEECETMIRRFDLDGDGVISFGEFKTMMA